MLTLDMKYLIIKLNRAHSCTFKAQKYIYIYIYIYMNIVIGQHIGSTKSPNRIRNDMINNIEIQIICAPFYKSNHILLYERIFQFNTFNTPFIKIHTILVYQTD
jgi:hypothetical protein